MSLAGYKEGYMLCGMWFVYWTCLLLPVSRVKWDKAKPAAIYCIIVYSVLMLISHIVRPNLYNDAMLSVISGSLIGYYYVNKGKTFNYMYIMAAGISFLPHIKRVVGITFALFVLSICIFDIYLNKDKNDKKSIILLYVSGIFIILSTILDKIIKNNYIVKTASSLVNNEHWSNPIGSIVNALISAAGMC